MLIIRNFDLRRTPETKMPVVTYGNTEDRPALRFMCGNYFINPTGKFADQNKVLITEPGQYAEINAQLTRKGKITLVDSAKDDTNTVVMLSVVADKPIKFKSNKGQNLFYLFDIKDRKHMFIGFNFPKGATYPELGVTVEKETEEEITLRFNGPGHKMANELEIPYTAKPATNQAAKTKAVEGEADDLAEYQKALDKVKRESKPAYEKKATKIDERQKAIAIADNNTKDSEATKSKQYNITKVAKVKRHITSEEAQQTAATIVKTNDIIILHHSVPFTMGLALAKEANANGKTVLVSENNEYKSVAI